MNLRCFIEIDTPEQIRQEIGALIDNLKIYDADVKWIPAQNLHLTLMFLGNTPEILLPEIKDSLSAVVVSYKPFYIKIADTGVFPNRKNPRICWIGMEEDTGILKTLQADVENSMKRLGFKSEDRAFNPHLTIGRVRSRQGMISVVNVLDRYKGRTFGNIMVENIKIMKSGLKPQGAEYTRLYEVPFGNK
jgi:RNA 2',3'-cyclic 3'-phosphodiesterase